MFASSVCHRAPLSSVTMVVSSTGNVAALPTSVAAIGGSSIGKIVRPTLRLWGESRDRHLLKHGFGSSVAKWLRN